MNRLGAAVLCLLLAAPVLPPTFPRDHGSHPEAAVEWWYYTGHLRDAAGKAYGFQLTFFRARDLHLAHFAWTDVGAGAFAYDEKTHLGLPGIAGASETGLEVFNEDWSVREDKGAVRMVAGRRDIGRLELTLTPAKPPVLHGGDGLSKKGPGDREYSRYVSITRFAATGALSRNGSRTALSGTAWFDHEWGPGALPAAAAGWDWFALQLSDGSDLMLYRLRRQDGAVDPLSSGTVVSLSGEARRLALPDFRIAGSGEWQSPRSGARYPARWRVQIPSEELDLEVRPALADQELDVSFRYWEGAVEIEGSRQGRPIRGRGYVELTGYAATEHR